MNEYDQRQYRRMKLFVDRFEAGNLNLRVLIDSLRGLLNVLEKPEDEWKTSFKREWWTLEVIYAIAADRGETHLSQVDENKVYEAVGNMKTLIDSAIIDEA